MIREYCFDQMINEPNKRLVLVIYDILDDKRRCKMVRVLESYGARIQKSAFEAIVNTRNYKKMISSIDKIVNDDDDVRIYRLNQSNEVLVWGNGLIVEDEQTVII